MRHSLELFEPHRVDGAAWWEGFSRTGLGWILEVRGDREAAIREFAEARRVGQESGNVGAEMQGLVFEADLLLASGNRDRAGELLASACDLVDAQPFFEGDAYFLEVVAAHAAEGGNAADGARLLGLARALRDLLGAHVWALLEDSSSRNHERVRSAVSPAEFDASFAEGRTLDPRSSAALGRAVLGVPTAEGASSRA